MLASESCSLVEVISLSATLAVPSILSFTLTRRDESFHPTFSRFVKAQASAARWSRSALSVLSPPLDCRLKVTCDGTHLHYIRAYQFVDSPEWEAMHENIDDVFQVTIRAEEYSTYICWTRLKLQRVLRHRPLLKVLLNTLIGKDITSKLYALNEQLAGVATASENATSNPYRGVTRSISVDAVNTEVAGRVRSTTWKTQRRYSNPRNDSKFVPSSRYREPSKIRDLGWYP